MQCISRERLVPRRLVGSQSAQTVPLSILDNTVANFALTSALWYFDKPISQSHVDPVSLHILSSSLSQTLQSYTPWCGQLSWIPYSPAQNRRHGRLSITYGSSSDPGVELLIARCSLSLSAAIPTSIDRLADGIWDATSVPSKALLCSTSLALHNTSEFEGLPCVSVQLTEFACGGIGIALRIVHAVADATSMVQFVKDWAAVCRAMAINASLPTLSPTFHPALLDNIAYGDIKAHQPDPMLIEAAHALPAFRYDWWTSADGCPAPMLSATKVPGALNDTPLGPPGDRMPWEEWDITAPVAHRHVYFSPAELQGIWEAAQLPALENALHISRLDALLAFIWRLKARAQGLADDSRPVHMAVTIGARARVSLPDSFLGSPITLARVSLPGAELTADSGLVEGAAAVRAAVAAYTPAAFGALLHELAHDVNPQHIWRAFLGRRHAIVTSWQNLGVYDVDFGFGSMPRYVDAVMPNLDGCVHVMEAGPREVGAGRWYDQPVCVALNLEEKAMDRLLKDPEVRKYQCVQI